MAESRPITIEAELRLGVSEQTAITCLNILQAYMNQHNNKDIVGHTNDDGTVWYEIVNKQWQDQIVRVKRQDGTVTEHKEELGL